MHCTKTCIEYSTPFSKSRLKWFGNVYFERDVPTRELWLPRCNTSQWRRRSKKLRHCRWCKIFFPI